MKKISNFIVEKRYFILAFVFVIMVISAISMTKVNINSDMTKYLPDNSQMKIGMNLMEKEFSNAASNNTIRVMFKGLQETEKEHMQGELSKINYVESVDYQLIDQNYNKEDYTLYIINTLYGYDSTETKSIERSIVDKYTDYSDMVYKVDDGSTPGLPTWILVIALVILMIILFIMCSSWVEPLLFLATIGVAIIINMGTNIFLDSVSSTTNSIASILLLVLSMDYSIILINRYRQELKVQENKFEAMKEALTNAFSSIASSAFTTVVGLLMLIFMNFKIGADLGIVLAKGVAISMICVLILLPALILMCDQLIQKTAKKELHINMDKIGAFSYKFRFVVLGVLVVFLIVVSFQKGNTKTSFILEEMNKIDEIFPALNTIVLLYENSDDEKVTELAEKIEKETYIKSMNGYFNTLGKEYTSTELADLLGEVEMDAQINLDRSLLDIIYYEYYKKGETGSIPLPDFLQFLEQDVLSNDVFLGEIDADIKEKMMMLSVFSSIEELEKQRRSAELSQILGMDTTMTDQLFSMTQSTSMSINGFMQLVSTNQNVAAALQSGGDASSMKQMQMIQTIIGSVMQNKAYTSAEFADLFSGISDKMDTNTSELMYLFYYSQHDSEPNWKMSMYDLFQFLSTDLLNDNRFANFFDEEIRQTISDSKSTMEDGVKQLRGEKYSRLIISTTLPNESGQTTSFFDSFTTELDNNLAGEYYLIGNSSMGYEMSKSFDDEMNQITLLTAISIFIVIAITFRSLIIPLILVLIIQGGVFATVSIIGLQGYSIHYLALLIVQSILMGATIDYGILFATYYREKRHSIDAEHALVAAYNSSIHTILTSGLIMILVTGILSFAFPDPTIGQICQSISIGALCATTLIVFILPGILAVFDKMVIRKKK